MFCGKFSIKIIAIKVSFLGHFFCIKYSPFQTAFQERLGIKHYSHHNCLVFSSTILSLQTCP